MPSLGAVFRRKDRWPNPDLSTGAALGIAKARDSYWEAKGPALDTFKQIAPEIDRVLAVLRNPVRHTSRGVNYDIYMIGRTPAATAPTIMFACRDVEARKQALAAVDKSGIMEQWPAGIELGEWEIPPHLVNLQL
ncbi:hypothetical protein BJX64DRAFT_266064 [Aspergillus heterothallicus]